MYSTLPSWLREDNDYLVDRPEIIQLACWATVIYDKDEGWFSGDIPEDVWDIDTADLVDEVTDLIENGASWKEAFERVKDRL